MALNYHVSFHSVTIKTNHIELFVLITKVCYNRIYLPYSLTCDLFSEYFQIWRTSVSYDYAYSYFYHRASKEHDPQGLLLYFMTNYQVHPTLEV